MWGTATTAKEARRVPAKRVDVARERGCRWDGIVVVCGGAVALTDRGWELCGAWWFCYRRVVIA